MFNQTGCSRMRILTALCAAAVLPYQPVAWAAAPAVVGEISVRGSAEVNGIGAVDGKTVFSGDRLVTDGNSTASVTSRRGARLVVVESSAVQIEDSSGLLTALLVRGGVAAVSPAQAPLIVEVGGMRIVPGKAGSVYAVQLEGSKLRVLAQSGTLSVEAANRTVSVPEGKTMDATVVPDPGNRGAASGGGSHLTDILIASTVALAATTIALGVAYATTGCTVSPTGVGTCKVH
jgi:hypothetical protein